MKQLRLETNSKDIYDIHSLFEEHVKGRFWNDVLPFEADTTLNNIKEQINNPNIYFAIAYVDDLPRGLMYMLMAPMPWNASPVAYGALWYVSPEFRGKGIGKALDASARLWARSRGCSCVLLGKTLDGKEETVNGMIPSEKIYIGKLWP